MKAFFRLIKITISAGMVLALSACASYYAPSSEVSGLMPTETARAIIKKHFGEAWLLNPTVKGNGFSDGCNNTIKPITFDKFDSGTYIAGRFSLITKETRWTSCAMVAVANVRSQDDAKALVEAINSLGGKIVSIYGLK